MICHTGIPNEKGWLRSNNCTLLCSVKTFKCRLTLNSKGLHLGSPCAQVQWTHAGSAAVLEGEVCSINPTIKICSCTHIFPLGLQPPSSHNDWDETCTMGPGHSYAQVYPLRSRAVKPSRCPLWSIKGCNLILLTRFNPLSSWEHCHRYWKVWVACCYVAGVHTRPTQVHLYIHTMHMWDDQLLNYIVTVLHVYEAKTTIILYVLERLAYWSVHSETWNTILSINMLCTNY